MAQGVLPELEEVVAYTYQYLTDVYMKRDEYTPAITNYELAIHSRLLLSPIDEGLVMNCIVFIVFASLSSECTKTIELTFGKPSYLPLVDIKYDFDKDKIC
jgi:hypothetical protein